MTNDRSPLQELKDSLRGRDGPRAREIKAIWLIARAEISDIELASATWSPGEVMTYPDPQNPMADLSYEKIVYDGGTVIECEGVVVCRLS